MCSNPNLPKVVPKVFLINSLNYLPYFNMAASSMDVDPDLQKLSKDLHDEIDNVANATLVPGILTPGTSPTSSPSRPTPPPKLVMRHGGKGDMAAH